MTALLVATIGGHLAQLVELEKRLGGLEEDRLWITFDTPQSRSLLADRRAKFIRSIEERDALGVLRGALSAHRIMRSMNITAVVSTGSAIALSFLPYAARRGIAAYYIESASRMRRPSLTGRLLERVSGVRLYRQSSECSIGRWRYGGSVFDGFQAFTVSPRPIRRVVVTLGTGAHGFRRLVDRLLTIIPADADVLWQTGSTDLSGLSIAARPVLPFAELEEAIRNADVVVGHAGCGTALLALKAGKYPVLVPRQPEFDELVDDHQAEFVSLLSGRDLAVRTTAATITLDDLVSASTRGVGHRVDAPDFEFG